MKLVFLFLEPPNNPPKKEVFFLLLDPMKLGVLFPIIPVNMGLGWDWFSWFFAKLGLFIVANKLLFGNETLELGTLEALFDRLLDPPPLLNEELLNPLFLLLLPELLNPVFPPLLPELLNPVFPVFFKPRLFPLLSVLFRPRLFAAALFAAALFNPKLFTAALFAAVLALLDKRRFLEILIGSWIFMYLKRLPIESKIWFLVICSVFTRPTLLAILFKSVRFDEESNKTSKSLGVNGDFLSVK